MRDDRREEAIAAFVARRARQTDEQFLSGCAVPDLRRGREIALAVRRAIGGSCGVEAGYIRAGDGFSRELSPLWGEDSLDAIDLWLDLQAQLDLDLPERVAERILTPFGRDRTVADFVLNVCEVLSDSDSVQPPAAADRRRRRVE